MTTICWISICVCAGFVAADDGVLASMPISSFLSSAPHERDYCPGQNVHANCAHDEVVIVTNATYGRMRTNSCVKTNLGYLGCGTSALHVLDALCSGSQSCDMSVPNDHLNNISTGCFEELKVYLRAAYACAKVYPLPTSNCNQDVHISMTSHSGLISSRQTSQSGCPARDSHTWILEAQRGQRIQLTLIDFNWTSSVGGAAMSRTCLHTYGYVVDAESGTKLAICGGGPQRVRTLHVSTSGSHAHRVKVVLTRPPRQHASYNFLIHYTALGCATLDAPSNAWVSRDPGSDDLMVGCNRAKQTWHLKCVDQRWVGVIGNCTHSYEIGMLALRESSSETLPHALIIVLIMSVAALISVSIFTVGFVLLRRYKLQALKGLPVGSGALSQVYEEPKYGVKTPVLVYDPQTMPDASQRNEYTHVWEQPLPPHPYVPSSQSRPNVTHNTGSRGVVTSAASRARQRSDSRDFDFLRQYYALDKEETLELNPPANALT